MLTSELTVHMLKYCKEGTSVVLSSTTLLLLLLLLLLLEKVMRAFCSLTQHTSVMAFPLVVLWAAQDSQLLEVTNQMKSTEVNIN